MKKVAVMTWFNYDNYGSVLQAYALLEILRKNDCDSFLINYDPNTKIKMDYEKQSLLQFAKTNLIKALKSFYTKKYYKNHSNNSILFNEFRKKKLSITEKCNNSCDLERLNYEFDCFICGSDQIWAPSVFDSKYFLDFVFDDTKKIAYAPSIGLPAIEDKNIKQQMSKLISKIKYLSTREENGVKIIKKICDRDAKLVLDPTLLLNKKDWEQSFSLKKQKKSYILYYCLSYNKNYYKLAKKISKKYNLDLKIIPVTNKDYKLQERIIKPIGPEEFLNEIYNSSLVITDSFHGTIFSINFNVPFITLKRFKDNKKSQNSRIYNILKIVSLENRIYNNDSIIDDAFNINFEDSNKKLFKIQQESKKFLFDSVNKCSNENINYIRTNYCTGCGACATVCPKKCIKIKINSYGFFEKKIDKEKCTNCGLCQKICPQNSDNTNIINIYDSKFYSGCSKRDDILKKSSSGGIAYELAQYYIEQDKIAVGCTYDYKSNKAKHIIVDKQSDLVKLSGSKYIQSDFSNIYTTIKNYPHGGIIFGTPCQIAAIDAFLKKNKNREKFTLVDLICHGVPSYHIWDKFIESKCSKENISNVMFRCKAKSWKEKKMLIIENGNEHYFPEKTNPFYHFFDCSIYNNKACYECRYRVSSVADIRIGDYWGKKFSKNNQGMSMIFVFNEQAESLLKRLSTISIQKQNISDFNESQQIKNLSIPNFYESMNEEFIKQDKNICELDLKYAIPIIKTRKRKKILFIMLNYIKEKMNK